MFQEFAKARYLCVRPIDLGAAEFRCHLQGMFYQVLCSESPLAFTISSWIRQALSR